MRSFRLVLLVLLLSWFEVCQSLNNNVLSHPPMGMNSWTAVYENVDEKFLLQSGQFFVSSGMLQVGYTIVCSDDGWTSGQRDQLGRLQADPSKFPSGIQKLSESLHAMGLKLGIYGASSSVVCSGRPGSLFHERIDAQTYASWGIDYIKQDNCGEYGYGNAKFQVFADAVNATGAAMIVSTEPFSLVTTPIHAEFANVWRTTNDIAADYGTIMNRIDLNDKWWEYVGPGQFADPDLLQCGNDPITVIECRTQFALWCITKSPLLLGTDVTKLSDDVLNIITNKQLIAINQDDLVVPARKRAADGLITPMFVGVAPCVSATDTLGINGVSKANMQWQLHPITLSSSSSCSSSSSSCLLDADGDSNTFIIYHPASRRCLSSRPYPNRDQPVPVLLPCAHAPASLSPHLPSYSASLAESVLSRADIDSQIWVIPSAESVGGLINAALNLSLAVGNSTLYGVSHGSDMSMLDQSYGLMNVTFMEYMPQPVCTSRSCDNYVPSQSFYFSTLTGRISVALMAANAYRCFEGECYQLTGHMPTFADLCLSRVSSISNDGIDNTKSGVHIWAGPLSDGDYVLAFDNRDTVTHNATAVFALLEVEGVNESTSMCARDLYANKEVGVVVGSISVTVASHDTVVIRLTPNATSC